MELFKAPLDAAGRDFPSVAISLMTLAWGAMLVAPTHTFEVSPIYSLMADFAPEFWWGFVFTVVSLLNLHGLFTRREKLVVGSSTALMFMWMLIAVAYLVSAPASATWPLLLGLSTLFGWTATKHKDEWQ